MSLIEDAKKLLPIVEAMASGKKVECRTDGWGKWEEFNGPIMSGEWRIKREPRTVYGYEAQNGSRGIFFEKAPAEHRAIEYGCELVEFREVLND